MRGKKISWLLQFMIMIIVFLMQSCGGGGGSKSSNTSTTSSVSSSSSLSSTSSSTSSGSALSNKLTITGLVVADALANADVEFTVGNQIFKTKADDQKQYSIDIDVQSENLAVPMNAKVTGANNNSWVQFAASFPSINKLKSLAGEDGILNVSEFFGVNISVLTTAELVLINENKEKISSDDERKWALLKVWTERQIDLASMMNLFIKDKSFNLPKNMTNTFEFLSDANVSLTYINLIKLRDSELINHSKNQILTDANQSKKPPEHTNGKYLINYAGSSYLIDIKQDGSGRFQTGRIRLKELDTWSQPHPVNYVDVPITWKSVNNSIEISFLEPVTYGWIGHLVGSIEQNNDLPCQYKPTFENPLCNLILESISLTPISENEYSNSVKTNIRAKIVNENLDIVNSYSEEFNGTMWDTKYFYKITNKDIENFEWHKNKFKYIFYANGTASQSNLKTQEEKIIDWIIEDGHLVIDKGSIDIWLNYPTDSGFISTVMNKDSTDPNLFDALETSLLIKRQPVKMTTEDWIGRWSFSSTNGTSSTFYDVYSNGGWRNQFDAVYDNNWSILGNTRQKLVSNGWLIQRDVLKIDAERYYFHVCQGFESDAQPLVCYIEISTKYNSFDGNTLWGDSAKLTFQDLVNNSDWKFNGTNTLEILGPGSSINRNLVKLSSDTMYDPTTNKLLQLISSTIQTVDICEYDIFSNCNNGVAYKLHREMEIKFPDYIPR